MAFKSVSLPTMLSFWGIGACVLFVIGTLIIATVLVMARLATHKLAGLEIAVLGPFSYLLFFVGIVVVNGRANLQENPWSNAGLILNILPFIYLTVIFGLAFIFA